MVDGTANSNNYNIKCPTVTGREVKRPKFMGMKLLLSIRMGTNFSLYKSKILFAQKKNFKMSIIRLSKYIMRPLDTSKTNNISMT